MVAVTTTTTPTPRRSAGRPRHLPLVVPPRVVTRPRPTTAAGSIAVGEAHRLGRCGCHRGSAPPAGVRLRGAGVHPTAAATYRRRRVAALAVALGLALAAWAALGALGGVLTAPVRSVPPPANGATLVEVAPGDTLWSIARRLQPEGDLRPLVDRLAATNGGPLIRAGDRLVVG